MSAPTATFYSTDSFLDAWMRGVEIAGRQWFQDQRPASSEVTKWTFTPDYDAITDNLGCLSTGEGAFLAAMYSFYNSTTGNRMMRDLGFESPGELAATLDEPRRRVIADLLVSYEGW